MRPAQAYTVTLQQVGANVVANGSGAIDLAGLFFAFAGQGPTDMEPFVGYIPTGSPSGGLVIGDVYGGFTGPTNFGPGVSFFATFGTGDDVAMSGNQGFFLVPTGYVSILLYQAARPGITAHSPAWA